jgi:hypothetical protein
VDLSAGDVEGVLVGDHDRWLVAETPPEEVVDRAEHPGADHDVSGIGGIGQRRLDSFGAHRSLLRNAY